MPPLITFTAKGLYCDKAKIYIDPWKAVDKALITHGHSDHARRGHKAYLCHNDSVNILRHRLGKISVQGIAYGKTITINGVTISFHPAGHVIGSAQIKLRDNKESWVISGDYKLDNDRVATPFEAVRCDHFVTESTFGLPVFRWKNQQDVYDEINQWWQENSKENKPSMICAYSLGKAQRVIKNIDNSIGPIVTHPSVESINQLIRESGIELPLTNAVGDLTNEDLSKAMFICPPSAQSGKWLQGTKHISVAMASGWMAIRGTRRRRNLEKGFVLSDHADWTGLNQAVKATGAEHIYVTHGYTDIYTKFLNGMGYKAKVVSTEYEGEALESVSAGES